MQILRRLRRGFASALCAALTVGALGAAAHAQTTTYFVETTGSDANSGLSEMAPFKTIGKAVDAASGQSSSVIRVKAGSYDQSHESSNPYGGFPIPIDFPNVSIQAFGATRPEIGDGVNDSAVLGLFEVTATSGSGPHATNVVFQHLEFVTEDSSGENAPSAVYAEAANGDQVEVSITSCLIQRSEMNHTSLDGHPSIRGIGGEGAALTLSVSNCTIVPNEPGGVVVDLGPDALLTNDPGASSLRVDTTEFTIGQGQAALAAVDMIIEAYDLSGPHGLLGDPQLVVTDCVIDSRAATGINTGFTYGIAYGGDARYGGSVSFGHSEVKIQRNAIHGCRQAGLYMLGVTDGSMDSSVNIQSWFLDNNLITENVGDGVLMDGGNSANAGQYLRWYLRGNMITDNDGDAVEVREIHVDNSGQGHLLNCTLAGNGGYGIRMTNSNVDEWLSHVQNSIVWGNASGSSTGWAPSPMYATLQHNIWSGTPPVSCVDSGCNPSSTCDYNVDVDPAFVDASNGDYHISSSSCAIEGGTNSPIATSTAGFGVDIDGDRRAIDGDGNSTTIVDIGADEYDP